MATIWWVWTWHLDPERICAVLFLLCACCSLCLACCSYLLGQLIPLVLWNKGQVSLPLVGCRGQNSKVVPLVYAPCIIPCPWAWAILMKTMQFLSWVWLVILREPGPVSLNMWRIWELSFPSFHQENIRSPENQCIREARERTEDATLKSGASPVQRHTAEIRLLEKKCLGS